MSNLTWRLDASDADKLEQKVIDRLKELGVGSGQGIAIQSRSSCGTALVFRAATRMGGTVFPLDPDMPEARRNSLLSKAGIRVLLRIDQAVSPDDWNPKLIQLTQVDTETPNRKYSGGELIIATSGSSGEAKGVLLSQHALTASARTVNQCLGFDKNSLWLACLPLFHIGGLSILTRAKLAQAPVIIHDRFSAERVWQDLNENSVSHISLVPVMLQRLLDIAEGEPPPKHLRVVLVGGAALNKQLAKKAFQAGWPIWVTYGMSETASQVATRPVQASDFDNPSSTFPIPLLDGVQCELLNEKGQSTTGTGRIKLKAEFLMSGYLGTDDSEAQGLDEGGWFLTSDIGQWNGRNLTVLGRADEVLVIGGKNIHPLEVEAMLVECPGIRELCVVGIQDEDWGHRMCVAFEGELSEGELELWCEGNVRNTYRPFAFRRFDQLPRLANGKLDQSDIKRVLE